MDSPGSSSSLRDRIAGIRGRIADAARVAGRDPGAVKLMAVSKSQPASAVVEAIRAGVTDFGENYAQELIAKAAAVDSLAASAVESLAAAEVKSLAADMSEPSSAFSWHYQGTLQRRKIKDLLPVVSTFHSVARREELDEISRRADCTVTCLLEVNIGDEPQKNGVLPGDVDALIEHASTISNVHVVGLMTVPPDDDDPSRWFAALRELAARHGLPEISMGMSSDFELAIREGATIVRVGTALFGPRQPRPA